MDKAQHLSWLNSQQRRVRQQNLIGLIAAFLWLAAALSATHANTQPFSEDRSLIPLALGGCAVCLQLFSRLLPDAIKH